MHLGGSFFFLSLLITRLFLSYLDNKSLHAMGYEEKILLIWFYLIALNA